MKLINTDNPNLNIDSWYDRHTRSWVTYLVDKNNNQVGDAYYDGDKTGRDYSIKLLKQQAIKG